MALSNAAVRAIAIRRSVAKRQAVTVQPAVREAANDNRRSPRVRGGAKLMSTAQLQACLAASGHAEHAAR